MQPEWTSNGRPWITEYVISFFFLITCRVHIHAETNTSSARDSHWFALNRASFLTNEERFFYAWNRLFVVKRVSFINTYIHLQSHYIRCAPKDAIAVRHKKDARQRHERFEKWKPHLSNALHIKTTIHVPLVKSDSFLPGDCVATSQILLVTNYRKH